MKQLLIFPVTFIITFTLASFFSASVASAQNIVGINIACRLDDFSRAAQVVGRGSWVVVMAGPGNCTELQEIYDANQSYGVNIVIRGYKVGAAFVESDAIAWAATLGSLDTHGQKIYFMPWNEPNHPHESGGLGTEAAADAVKDYIAHLSSYFSAAGLRNPGDKIALLSPMIDQHNYTFDTFIERLGRGSFFGQFEGIAMNLYDDERCGSPFCSGSHRTDASRFAEVLAEMGASGKPVFALESGTIIGEGVRYYDTQLYNFFSAAIPRWETHSNFRMFSVFSYDPHYASGGWNIFGSRTSDFLESYGHAHATDGPDGYSSFNKGGFLVWRESQGLTSCDGCGWAPTKAGCVSCWATSSFVEGPVGYLDQFTVFGTDSVGPLERRWCCWAPCETPLEACNPPETNPPGCEDALNKMGFPGEGSSGALVYPQTQVGFFEYFKEAYPRLLSPKEIETLDEIVSSDLSTPGWVEFESAGGESGGDSRTKVTHPRSYLFGNSVGAKVEAMTQALWKHFTAPVTQAMRPQMIKDDRSRLACWKLDGDGDVVPGCEDEGDTAIHFGAMADMPGLFAADYAEGDYYGEAIGGCSTCPPVIPGFDGQKCKCGSELYKYKTDHWVHIGPEERTFERILNAERDETGTPRRFESLNPGWQALAETWNSLAGPVGLFRQLFYTADLDDAVLSEAENLFDPHPQVWPVARDVYKSQMYANTQFKYKYGPWSYPSGPNGMEIVKYCDDTGNCWDCDITEDNPDGVCRAHFPFWGGLKWVRDFVCRNLTDEGTLRETLCPDPSQ